MAFFETYEKWLKDFNDPYKYTFISYKNDYVYWLRYLEQVGKKYKTIIQDYNNMGNLYDLSTYKTLQETKKELTTILTHGKCYNYQITNHFIKILGKDFINKYNNEL